MLHIGLVHGAAVALQDLVTFVKVGYIPLLVVEI